MNNKFFELGDKYFYLPVIKRNLTDDDFK
jgi:hypothetical protein